MMPSKSVRFNTIINVREHQKKQTTKELSQITRQKKEETEKLSGMHDEHSVAMTTSFSSPRSKANDVQANSAFIKRLAADITHQTKKVEKIEVQEADKRVELLERVKAKTVIEKLQQKINEEIRVEADKKEQTLLDTLGQRPTDKNV